MRGISWAAKELLASQEALYSIVYLSTVQNETTGMNK